MTPSEMTPHELGIYGEDLAEKFYEEQGFEILERNYRYYHDEIDLIAKDLDYIVFVEVKTRTKEGMWFRPAHAVNLEKRWNILRASRVYLRKRNIYQGYRYDILEITVSKDGTYEINQIRGAFDSNGKLN